MALLSAGGGGTTIVKSASSGSDLYKVPSGKVFEGQLWCNNQSGIGNLNGTNLAWPYYSNYFSTSPLPITLNSGDVVKAAPSGTTYLVGVEK